MCRTKNEIMCGFTNKNKRGRKNIRNGMGSEGVKNDRNVIRASTTIEMSLLLSALHCCVSACASSSVLVLCECLCITHNPIVLPRHSQHAEEFADPGSQATGTVSHTPQSFIVRSAQPFLRLSIFIESTQMMKKNLEHAGQHNNSSIL